MNIPFFEMMYIALLIWLLIQFVGMPLIDDKPPAVPSAANPGEAPAHELIDRKEGLLISLRELEFDHNMGKITAEDYQVLRADLESEALRTLRAIDDTTTGESASAP